MDKNDSKIKISLDILDNLHTSQLEGAEYDCSIGISRFSI